MRAFNRCLALLAASLMLVSCGGGGGSGGDGAFQPTPSGTLSITATASQLPLNRDDVGPFFGSPFMSELDITWRRANGDLVSGQEVAVAITPVTVASFSTLDDPATPIELDAQGNYLRGNEFLDRLGSGPVDVTGGHATIFVHSSSTAGVATVTVTARDTASNTTISRTFAITVNNIASSLPASLAVNATPNRVYIQETGGPNTTIVTAVVRDGGGQFVPNPGSGNTSFNNVQFDVVGGANYGTMSALGAGGSSTGPSVKTRTVQGVASASFRAGTIQGPVQIRTTVDRADNNVDNGITDPLVSTESVVVSDGKLFSLVITSPTQEAITTGTITGGVGPNGTYSLVVSALATDRQGNPVPAGTSIRFGSIDAPATGFPVEGPGRLVIAGNDGDAQEAGTLFTSQAGCFTGFIRATDLPRCSSTGPGERPGPGDTLLVFGDLVPGNRDLESARTVATINTATSLNVSVPFNRNDDSGNIVNSGPILPYVIGRSVDANIRDSGTFNGGTLGITNADGVATALLNYPNNRLGKLVYLHAQGDGVGAAGAIKKVTDIGAYVLPGIADAVLTANPEEISGNTTASVTVCVIDALGAPLQGLAINFTFSGLNSGAQGFVDNIPGSGIVVRRTGPSGCTVAAVRTLGISTASGGGTSTPRVVFSVGGLSDDVEITASGEGSLTAAPSSFRGSGGTITLTLRDSAGNPVPGVNINTQCTGDVSIETPAGVTNAQGQTTAVINGDNLNGYGDPGDGECVFTAASGEETTVEFTGIDLCGTTISPPPPPGLCGTTTTPIQLTVAVSPAAAGPATCGLTVASTPAGITCSAPAGGGTQTCNASYDQGTSVTLVAVGTGTTCPANTAPVTGVPPATPYKTITYSGGCTQNGPLSASVALSSPQSCNVSVTVTP